jgi:hypothetical protein
VRDRYGRTRFGQSCLMARRLIEAGVRFVTVNMFETVFDEITWDIHGSKPFTDIEEMRRRSRRTSIGRYRRCWRTCRTRPAATTMVLAMGEFGRTPKINPAGGRDHHPGVWTILMGGGPIQGRPRHRRVGRTRLRPEVAPGDTPAKWRRRSSGARPRPAQGTARPATARFRWPITA